MGKKVELYKDSFFVRNTISSESPTLAGSKCKYCGKIYFPHRRICANCLRKDEMEEVPLSRIGKLHSYTILYVAPQGFEAPYALGYVDLPEGVRIFSMLTDCEPYKKKLRIDMKVETVLGKIRESESGVEIISYKFKPFEGETK